MVETIVDMTVEVAVKTMVEVIVSVLATSLWCSVRMRSSPAVMVAVDLGNVNVCRGE